MLLMPALNLYGLKLNKIGLYLTHFRKELQFGRVNPRMVVMLIVTIIILHIAFVNNKRLYHNLYMKLSISLTISILIYKLYY